MSRSTPAVVVPDASAVVALLIDAGPAGVWAGRRCRGRTLAAPSVLHYEVANVLRRQHRAGVISDAQAATAHRAMIDMRLALWPYAQVAGDVWRLRHSMTSHDAAYCAVAARVGAPLLTLDRRLARTAAEHVQVETPTSG